MKDFIRHVNIQNQQFKCHPSGVSNQPERYIVDLHNELGSGLEDSDSTKFNKILPTCTEEFLNLWRHHNGVRLYCNDDTSGLYLFPLHEIEVKNKTWKLSISFYDEEDLYDFQKEGIAFGEVSHSNNFFILYNEKIYYSSLDGCDHEPIANSLLEFLERIMDNPPQFLMDMGCYCRYSDGETDQQWIPFEYIEDIQ